MKDSTKIIKVEISDTKKVLRKFAITLGKAMRGEKIKPHRGISFESIDGLRNFLTNRRLEIISVVKHKKPNSVYQLSKMLKRDLKSVNTDLKILKNNDFIDFKEVKEGRKRLVPIVEFDKINIIVKV